MTPMTEDRFSRFAAEWYAAWDSADLDRILGHSADDLVFESPVIVAFNGDPRGGLQGRAALRDYFARALGRYSDRAASPPRPWSSTTKIASSRSSPTTATPAAPTDRQRRVARRKPATVAPRAPVR